jgi:hypothetical protein
MIKTIDNLFEDWEIKIIEQSMNTCYWKLTAFLERDPDSRYFWYKNIIDTPALDIFLDKVRKITSRNIIIDRLYVNGQAHGQCGYWHTDQPVGSINCFTIVYFNKEWLPEYGGHLLIKTNNITSILPEQNKAVILDSTIEHMGLEPTVHCRTQRESIACKFRIINE